MTYKMTLSNDQIAILLGIPCMTLFLGNVTAGNEIGYGLARDVNYQFSFWLDWGSTDNNNLIAKAAVKNNTGSTQTILFRGNWRSIVSTVSVS